jgi:PAS domain S-box-containing protein
MAKSAGTVRQDRSHGRDERTMSITSNEPSVEQKVRTSPRSMLSVDELSRRPTRDPDYEAESRALVALAQEMAVSPDRILHKLAKTALELCGAHSAGLSLLEEADQKRYFHWRVIVGAWEHNLNGGTPRDFGPCGTVLDQNAPLICTHPEQDFPYWSEVKPVLEEGLLIPFYVNGEAIGTLWVIAHDGTRRFDREDLRLMTSLGAFTAAAYQTWLSVNAARDASRAALNVMEDAVQSRQTMEALSEQLRESERRLHTLSDNIAQLAWTCDRLGDVTWYNQRWLDYTGLTFEEMKDWGWKQVQHPDHVDRVVAGVRHSRDTGEIWEDTFPLRRKDGTYRWFLSRAVPIRDAVGNVVRWFGTNTDVTELRDAEERQQLLINELNHRVQNVLATVQSIAAQTFRAATLDSSLREKFEARLVSLSNAHSILAQESWKGAEIHQILMRALEPHVGSERLRMQGPRIRLSAKAALAISMGIQELATNAVKYGALSNETGRIDVTWTVDGPNPGLLNLRWTETGGPVVSTPTRKGFGSRLIERNLAHDLDGEVKIDYRPEGIVCTIVSSLQSVRERPPEIGRLREGL